MTTTHLTATAEHEQYASTLAAQQARILGIISGLSDDDLRRAMLPSGWSPLGLLFHLADHYRFWFRRVLVADMVECHDPALPDFGLDPERSAADVMAEFSAEAAHACTVIPQLDLAAGPAYWPEGLFGDWRPSNARQIVVSSIVETSGHAGHLDAVRELIDGATWSFEHGRAVVR